MDHDERDEELVQFPGDHSWWRRLGMALCVVGVGIGVVISLLLIGAAGAWIGWMNNWWGWFDPPAYPSC